MLVGEYPGGLRISLELDDILIAVIGQHDSSLRPATNLGDVFDCLYRHVASSLCFWWWLVWDAIGGFFRSSRESHVSMPPRILGELETRLRAVGLDQLVLQIGRASCRE